MNCELIRITLKARCETYRCREMAAFRVGRPDGSEFVMMNLCEDCARNLIESGLKHFPDLMPKVDSVPVTEGEAVQPKKGKAKSKASKSGEKSEDTMFADVTPFEEAL